jgi:hypothetical protein
MATQKIVDFRIPGYFTSTLEWQKYRLTYKGGIDFRSQYLQKFSSRETDDQFNTRRDLSPIPTFAKSAINDIRNAIYQPMIDIVRRDGSEAYLSGWYLRGCSRS